MPVGGCVIVWLSLDFGLKEPDHLPQVLDEGFFLVLDSLLSEDEVDFLLLVLLLPVVAFLREDADEVLPEPVPESAVPVVAPASGITVSFPESEITFILTCLLPFLTRNPCVAGAAVWALTASVFCLMSSRSTAITPPAPAAPPTREQQSARTTIFAAVPLVFFGGSVL